MMSKWIPQYSTMSDWELYCSTVEIEFVQSLEEGLDVEQYRALFDAVQQLPRDDIRQKLGDLLYEIIERAPMREDYPYNEPSELDDIRALRAPFDFTPTPYTEATLLDKISGAWHGRIAGCLLGKPVEGVYRDELADVLKATDNYPLSRYIKRGELEPLGLENCRFRFLESYRKYVDEIDGMPADDDTNYMIIAQTLLDQYGRDFTAFDMSRIWLNIQRKDSYCTAERVAFCNFLKGYVPPASAHYQNPYREWIGAQIRGDYFGYINPGDPEKAAEMAFRDASMSHTKNGIYGEMYIAAMLAASAVCGDTETVIEAGLAQIPATSRLYHAIKQLLKAYHGGLSAQDFFNGIHAHYDERRVHHWCHVIANALIVTGCLLYGNDDYSRSICMAVEVGFDTDCNGATVGSILGMKNGLQSIDKQWLDPLNDTLYTTLFGNQKLVISERIQKTFEHMA